MLYIGIQALRLENKSDLKTQMSTRSWLEPIPLRRWLFPRSELWSGLKNSTTSLPSLWILSICLKVLRQLGTIWRKWARNLTMSSCLLVCLFVCSLVCLKHTHALGYEYFQEDAGGFLFFSFIYFLLPWCVEGAISTSNHEQKQPLLLFNNALCPQALGHVVIIK